MSDDMSDLARVCVIVKESIRSLHSLLSELSRPKLKAFVIDLFCTGVFEVCKDLSIPVYSFCTASTIFLTFSLYLPTMDREIEGEFVDQPEPVKIPGHNLIRIQDLLDQVKNRKINDCHLYLFHVSRMFLAKGIFINSWDDLELASLKAVKH